MNSLDFIKQRLKTDTLADWIPRENWDEAEIINPINFMKDTLFKGSDMSSIKNELEFEGMLDNDKITMVHLKYNPDYEYEYCSSKQSTHDGTLLFTINVLKDAIGYLIRGCSCDTRKIPKDMDTSDIDSISKYDIEYVIGDMVLNKTFGEKVINGNRMDGETDTVLIPISMKFVRNNN